MHFVLLIVDADLTKDVVQTNEVSVKDFQLDDRTFTTQRTETTNTFTLFAVVHIQ